MMSAPRIYSTASLCRNEVINDKQVMLGEFIYLYMAFSTKFKNNKYMPDAISCIYDYYSELLSELDREHDIYDAIMEYLSSLESIENFEDKGVLEDLSSIFDDIEETLYARVNNTTFFTYHFFEIIETGFLDDVNCQFNNYDMLLTEDKKKQLISLIPKVQ